MQGKTYPALLLAEQDAQLIRDHALASDQAGMLAPAIQELIHERGWLRLLAPRAIGGGEIGLPDMVRFEEALAQVDGSVGWTVTLCAGAGWFAGFLAPSMAHAVMDTPRVCVGGSGAPSGFADVDGDGYRLSGSWDFATGAPMTTHFTLNAVVREGGQPVTGADGAPLVRAFIVPAKLVTVIENWHATGLRGTASHSFALDNVKVGAQHAFDITLEAAQADGPLYRFPFLSLAFVTLAANVAGMASHFIALARETVAHRRHHLTHQPLPELPRVRHALEQAGADMGQARERFYELLERMWDTVCRGEPVAALDERELHEASLELADVARRAADSLYPLCGLRAADQRSSIGLVWRDLHTATQHALMLPVLA